MTAESLTQTLVQLRHWGRVFGLTWQRWAEEGRQHQVPALIHGPYSWFLSAQPERNLSAFSLGETDPNSTFALIAPAIHHLWFPWHNLHVEFGNTVKEGSERLPKLHWKVLCKYYSTNREGIYHVRIKQIIKGSCNWFRLDAEWSPNSKPWVWDNQREQSAQASSKTAKMAWQKSEN